MPNRTDGRYMHQLVPLSAACIAQSMGTDAFSVLWAAVSTVGTAVPPAVRFNLPTVGNGSPYVYSAASYRQSVPLALRCSSFILPTVGMDSTHVLDFLCTHSRYNELLTAWPVHMLSS
jgi:hypothetical protein